MLLTLLASVAIAYESDTLTDRHVELPDVTHILDRRTQDILDDAIAWTNRRTGCEADLERTRRLLARAIHVRTANNELVGDRGGLRAFGFDRYSAWIEKGGAARRSFDDRRDIFGSATVREAPLLKWAGVCSTVRVHDVLLGTDKLDHFFEEGHKAWKKSEYGEDLDAAIAWATETENTIYGLKTSDTFSWADLRADFDGLHFYDTLLDDGSVAVLGPDGCVVAGAPFTWADWVTWEYDEVLNPSVHTPSAQMGITRHLELNREAYCSSYRIWGEGYSEHLARVLATRPIYASDEAPPRSDPYQLDQLCGPASGT